MTNALGCGDNLPQGSCIGKLKDWIMTYDVPVTMKVGIREFSGSAWDFYPQEELITCGEIDWQFYPFPTDRLVCTNNAINANFKVFGRYQAGYGTGFWISGGNTFSCYDSSFPQKMQEMDFEFYQAPLFSSNQINYAHIRGKNKDTGKVAFEYAVTEGIGTLFNGVLDVVVAPNRFGPIILQDSIPSSRPINYYDYLYSRAVSLGSFTIEGFAILDQSHLWILEITVNGQPYSYKGFNTRPATIRAFQDDFVPELQQGATATRYERLNWYNLNLNQLPHQFFFETLSLQIEQNDDQGRKNTNIFIAPSCQNLLDFTNKYPIWLQEQAAKGNSLASQQLDSLEGGTLALQSLWQLIANSQTRTLLELQSPFCSNTYPLVCWDCRSGCPEGTCFKCVDSIDQKICCYGTGGKAIATVGLEEDLPDC